MCIGEACSALMCFFTFLGVRNVLLQNSHLNLELELGLLEENLSLLLSDPICQCKSLMQEGVEISSGLDGPFWSELVSTS